MDDLREKLLEDIEKLKDEISDLKQVLDFEMTEYENILEKDQTDCKGKGYWCLIKKEIPKSSLICICIWIVAFSFLSFF